MDECKPLSQGKGGGVTMDSTQPASAKAYKIPSGGLFKYCAAPHYMFEIIAWYGGGAV